MYDVYEIRKQFPMLDGKKTMQGHPLVFLDNASTTFKPYSVIEAMNRYYKEETSNGHRGDYDLCYNIDVEIRKARETVAKFINSDTNEVVFTYGDTEALNLVAYGYGLKYLKKGDGILISEIEHASNALPWYRISQLTGAEIYFMDTDGHITADSVNKSLKEHPNIKIVAFAAVSNVFGYHVDVKNIAKIVHEHNAVIVIDGAQSVPHIKTDFKDLDIDFLTFSAHKMCGPTGIGALIGKYHLLEEMDPFILGGGNNVTFNNKVEYELLPPPAKFESGTLNISGIFGFKAAIEFINSLGIENIEKHEEEIYKYLLEQIKDIDNLVFYNKGCKSSILSFNVTGNFAQDEGTLFNSYGIALRSGNHCAKMTPNITKALATVRLSTYLYTTKEEIDAFLNVLRNGGDILDAYFK